MDNSVFRFIKVVIYISVKLDVIMKEMKERFDLY